MYLTTHCMLILFAQMLKVFLQVDSKVFTFCYYFTQFDYNTVETGKLKSIFITEESIFIALFQSL